jgi:hypothetical protein
MQDCLDTLVSSGAACDFLQKNRTRCGYILFAADNRIVATDKDEVVVRT